MYRITIVTNKVDRFAEFSQALAESFSTDLQWAESVEACLKHASDSPPDLMIVDESTDNTPALEIARRIVAINALINLAVVSSLPDNEFHEAGEGLGILAQLPSNPQKQHATDLAEKLESILGALG